MADVVKVTLNNDTLIDISDSTITPETVLQSYVGYEGDGDRLIGTLTAGGSENMWYTTTTSLKSVKTLTTTTGDFELTAGNVLIVKTTSPAYSAPSSQWTFNVDGTGAVPVLNKRGRDGFVQQQGEAVPYLYDGTNFVAMVEETDEKLTTSISAGNTTTNLYFYPKVSNPNIIVQAYYNVEKSNYRNFTDFYYLVISGVPTGLTVGTRYGLNIALNSAQTYDVIFHISGDIVQITSM